MSKYTFLFLFGIFFFVYRADAADTVIISEIAWMGTSADSQNEWIELYNPSAQDISLAGWMLIGIDATSTIKISKALSGTIPASGFFLLERTNNETVPNINVPQEQIYSGSLLDPGENIELKNSAGQIIDSIYASNVGWPAGDKTSGSKKPMERNLDGSWQTSAIIDGTPQNTVASAPQPPPAAPPPPPPTESPQSPTEPPPPPSPVPSAPETPENQTPEEPAPLQQQEPPAKIEIYLSELIPNPLGADSDLEFIELVNLGEDSVDLSGWTIVDPTKTFTVETGVLLEPKKYAVFYSHDTHISLNNDGDTIKLFDKNNELKDGIQYGKTKEGFSLVKVDSSWFWTAEATPGEKNKLSLQSENVSETAAPPSEPNVVAIATAPDINENTAAKSAPPTAVPNHNPNSVYAQNSVELVNQWKAQSSEWLTSNNIIILLGALLFGALSGLLIFIIRKKLRA